MEGACMLGLRSFCIRGPSTVVEGIPGMMLKGFDAASFTVEGIDGGAR